MCSILRNEISPFELISSLADFFLIPYALFFGLVYPVSRRLADEQDNYRKMLDYQFTSEENRIKCEIIKSAIKQV